MRSQLERVLPNRRGCPKPSPTIPAPRAERPGGTALASEVPMKSSSWALLLAMVACGVHPQGWGDGRPPGGDQGYGDDAGVRPVADAGRAGSPPKAPSEVYPAFPVD